MYVDFYLICVKLLIYIRMKINCGSSGSLVVDKRDGLCLFVFYFFNFFK